MIYLISIYFVFPYIIWNYLECPQRLFMNQTWQLFWDTHLKVLKYWAFSFQSCCVQWYLCSWGWTVANNYSGEWWQGRAIFTIYISTKPTYHWMLPINVIFTHHTVYLHTLISYFLYFLTVHKMSFVRYYHYNKYQYNNITCLITINILLRRKYPIVSSCTLNNEWIH